MGASWVRRGSVEEGGPLGLRRGGSLGGLTSAFNAEQLVSFLANFIVH